MKSLKEEKEKVSRAGAERLGLRNFYHSPESYLNFFFFRKGGKWKKERWKDGWGRKKTPWSQSEGGCLVSQTPAQDQLMCPFSFANSFLKFNPQLSKNLSLISNSNKLTAWWLLFCFLLPNSSLQLHNKSVQIHAIWPIKTLAPLPGWPIWLGPCLACALWRKVTAVGFAHAQYNSVISQL